MTETEMHDRPATERGVLIVINEVEYTTQRRDMTGRELMTLADIPDGNHLFLEVPGPGDDRQIGPDEEVRLHRKMRFYDVPVGNFG